MHIAFRKDLADGTVTMTSAGNWDGLKYQLTKLAHFNTADWDRHSAVSDLRNGDIIHDGIALWQYINIEALDVYNKKLFEGSVIFLHEVDPTYS